MKSILVVGGGYGGITAALELKRKGGVRVMLVDRKEYFEVTPAQLHALVDPARTGARSRIAYRDILGESFVLGEVGSMEEHAAVLSDGRRIEFDVLILASGTRYPEFPIAKSLDQGTIALRQGHNEAEHARFKSAPAFLVIGGGAVGVELAGELASHSGGKRVRLAHAGARLMENLSPKSSSLAMAHLKELGVEVLLNTRDARPSDGEVVYMTVSPEPATGFLEAVVPGILDGRKRIKVDEYLKVRGFAEWYAIGDANDSADAKQAIAAEKQGKYAARSVLASLGIEASIPKPYRVTGTPAIVPIGKDYGFMQMPFGTLAWKPLVDLKRKDYLIAMTRRKLGIRR